MQTILGIIGVSAVSAASAASAGAVFAFVMAFLSHNRRQAMGRGFIANIRHFFWSEDQLRERERQTQTHP